MWCMNEINEKSKKEWQKEGGCVGWKGRKRHFIDHRVDGCIVSQEGGAMFKHFSFEFRDSHCHMDVGNGFGLFQ